MTEPRIFITQFKRIEPTELKLSTLLFDNVLIERYIVERDLGEPSTFQEWAEKYLRYYEPKISDKTIEYFLSRWTNIRVDFRAYNSLQSGKMLSREISAAIDEVANRCLAYQKEDPLGSLMDRDASLSFLRYIFSWWQQMPKDVALLGGPNEISVLQKVGAPNPKYHLETGMSLLSAKAANFSELSWTDIMELRNHSYYDAFRQKLIELTQMRAAGNLQNVSHLTKYIFEEALLKLVQKVRPQPRLTTIKAIIGNLPTGPLPINPISIPIDTWDVYKEFEREKEFSWLYFVLDFTQKTKQ